MIWTMKIGSSLIPNTDSRGEKKVFCMYYGFVKLGSIPWKMENFQANEKNISHMM